MSNIITPNIELIILDCYDTLLICGTTNEMDPRSDIVDFLNALENRKKAISSDGDRRLSQL